MYPIQKMQGAVATQGKAIISCECIDIFGALQQDQLR